jgi:hypothetical protein
VPEWDDAVDAGYDFEHDELSVLDRKERNLDYIWDIFPKERTPIDGVLISREQVESTARKAERLADYGIYDDPILSIPDWLPTISDCGAWGYKSLPFPPYGNAEMLDFYETLDVTVGVTIDHLVLGSGKEKGRLYLDERAFEGEFNKSEIPSRITDSVDLMIDEWPSEWPEYVSEYEPSIRRESSGEITPFTRRDFEGDPESVLDRLETDSRAVYRQDDKQFRYDLTLRNARKMRTLYEEGEYPFRLMVAIQGWEPEQYTAAAEEVLELGYDYLGIGGVAGSPIHEVRKIVKDVGQTVKNYERTNNTRIDTHVFGFAKSEAFETIGRSGMTSFDSASMLRAAWTGGGNYRLDTEKRYDAIRVRYPNHGAEISDAVESALRGREVLEALRAYAENESIIERLREWESAADEILSETEQYLRENRHKDRFDKSRLQDVEVQLRDDFEYARKLKGYFSEDLRDEIVRNLRKDGPEDPIPFEEYTELTETARGIFKQFPRMVEPLEAKTPQQDSPDQFDQIWHIVKEYATWVGDEDLLEEYQKTLADRPWEQCNCSICEDHGIEICIFRGNDRNRRRGFHNTRQFYEEFSDSLPKTLVLTRGTASLSSYDTVESYLRNEKPEFWQSVHDLPVAEIGVVDANGVHEWWESTPNTVSFAPTKTAESLKEQLKRYESVYVSDIDEFRKETQQTIEGAVSIGESYDEPSRLRKDVLSDLGGSYSVGRDFLPYAPELSTDSPLDILIVDQCSGSKYVPDETQILEDDEISGRSNEEILRSDGLHGVAARDLYTGRQQESITKAIRKLRNDGHNIQRYFISAGFGLVEEMELLPPYEVTFSSMKVAEIRNRSKELNIQKDLWRVLENTEYDIAFFALGSDYYNSVDIDKTVQQIPPGKIGVVFNREIVDEQFENIISVPARTEDAKRHGTIVIGLKGLYLENFAKNLPDTDQLDPETIQDLCLYVDEGPEQAGIERF